MSAPLLHLNGVARSYGRAGGLFRPDTHFNAVDGVTLSLARGEALGLVGESGSGKSTLGRLASGIEAPSAGEIRFEDAPFARIGSAAWRRERRTVQVIFQNPSRALDPRLAIAAQVQEALRAHGLGDAGERRQRSETMLARVGLGGLGSRYPHQLSGGQMQRAAIARALVLGPRLVVCDEAVSALDVSVQAQIVNLLRDLQDEFGLAYLFISHDLGVVRYLCRRVAVMRQGRIVETGPTDAVFERPEHPYTQALLAAIPAPTPAARRARDRATLSLKQDEAA